MSDECIHGFSDGLCATCNPKPVAEAAVAVKAAPRTRTAVAPRATVRSLRDAARIPAGVSPGDTVLEQRIYHVTHIRNLPAILGDRAIVAGANPVVDIAPESLRLERMEAKVGTGEKVLDDYVPFFLSPDATLWQALRTGSEHPRLSREASVSDASEFVFLVSTVRHVAGVGHDFVVTDGNSENTYTRFATSRADADRMLYRLRADSGDALLDAELLVEGSLPLESVNLIGVQNDKVRAAVRDILAGSDFNPKISVYPPWFQPTE